MKKGEIKLYEKKEKKKKKKRKRRRGRTRTEETVIREQPLK